MLSSVTVDLAVTDDSVDIVARVSTTDRTGVEMEALTAVSVAALTVIDMVKAVDKGAIITDVRVERSRAASPATGPGDRPVTTEVVHLPAVVVVASTRAAAGLYADQTGPLLVEWLRSLEFTVGDPVVVPDGPPVGGAISAAIAAALAWCSPRAALG